MMTEVIEKQTLTLSELDEIESNIVLKNIETLRQQFRDVNASDRTIYVNTDELFVLAKRHVVVAEKLMAAIESYYTERMSNGR